VKAAIRQFIEEGGDFESTALALYAWQRANNPEYDRFCGSVKVSHWSEIPAVPSTLFRDLSFTCFPKADAATIFHTSGTTMGRPGIIHLQDTDIYDLSARRHAEACLGGLPSRGVSLAPSAATSSLGHMCRSFVPDLVQVFDDSEGLNIPAAWSAIEAAAASGEAVFLPGTAFAWADLIDDGHDPVFLPPGSVLMVTGGFKGRRRTVAPQMLTSALARQLPGASVVGEYGMSELGSQLWAIPADAAFRPPPWMRVMAINPWTGNPDTRGLLRFYDLANHQTVLAIETQDVGIVLPDGSVRLEGRLKGADLRGCSLRMETSNA
jgi:hypothetical protein